MPQADNKTECMVETLARFMADDGVYGYNMTVALRRSHSQTKFKNSACAYSITPVLCEGVPYGGTKAYILFCQLNTYRL